jgi:hypothetical protein
VNVSDVLFFHIAAGAISLVSGGAALVYRKGAGPHRAVGTVFFLAMLVMTVCGAIVAVARHQPLNIAAASLTFYLVATAWMAAMRKDGESGAFEVGALVFALAVAAGAAIYGLNGSRGAAPFLYGFASVAMLGAVLDVSVVARKGVSGAQRIARHLWRMGLALAIAALSFFIGQAKFLPAIVRDTQLNLVPVIAVIVVLVFWLLRVLLTNWYGSAGGVHAAPARATGKGRVPPGT